MNRYFAPVILGLGGLAVLLSLGVWQVQRLAWKEGMLAQIRDQISAEPVPLFSQTFTEFMAVSASGRITDQEVHVLTSRKPQGAGFRVISAFETDGRRILLDRGFIPEVDKASPRAPVDAKILGNFRTVDEVDGFTPEPDLRRNIHFAREVPVLAATLGTEPILVILRETSEPDPPVSPWPVDTAGISNDHLEYAITWFSLAAAWAGMTGFWIWRIRRRTA